MEVMYTALFSIVSRDVAIRYTPFSVEGKMTEHALYLWCRA
jgi:hypothetical protein